MLLTRRTLLKGVAFVAGLFAWKGRDTCSKECEEEDLENQLVLTVNRQTTKLSCFTLRPGASFEHKHGKHCVLEDDPYRRWAVRGDGAVFRRMASDAARRHP